MKAHCKAVRPSKATRAVRRLPRPMAADPDGSKKFRGFWRESPQVDLKTIDTTDDFWESAKKPEGFSCQKVNAWKWLTSNEHSFFVVKGNA